MSNFLYFVGLSLLSIGTALLFLLGISDLKICAIVGWVILYGAIMAASERASSGDN